MRTIKTLLKILLGALLLLGVTITAVVVLFNPNDYKPQIRKALHDGTGREVRIDGEISWSLFPYLGVTLGPVAMQDAGGETEFASVQSAGIELDLWPILHQELAIDRIYLDGLRLNLVAGGGENNWDDLIAAKTSTKSTTSAPALPKAVHIGAISIRNAMLNYRDAQSGVVYRLEKISLESSEIRFKQAFDLRAGFALKGVPGSALDVRLQTRVLLDPGQSRYALRDLGVRVRGKWAGNAIDTEGHAHADFDGKAGTLLASDLDLRSHNLHIQGGLDLHRRADGWHGQAGLDVPTFSPRRWIEQFTGRDLDTRDSKVLASASAAFTAKLNGPKTHLQLKSLQLDDTRFSGTLDIARLTPTAISFKLEGDELDLDRYLPASATTKSTPVPTQHVPPRRPADSTPTSAPVKLTLQGDFDFQRFTVAKLSAENIHMHFAARRGVFTVDPIRADFYNGKFTGDVRVDTTAAKVPVAFHARLAGVAGKPLSRDLLGSERLSGTADAEVKMRAQLVRPDALSASLNGQLGMTMRDGAVVGIDVVRLLRQANARLQGRALPAQAKPVQKTDFTELDVALDVADGVARFTTLDLRSAALGMSGSGQIDLPRQRINVLLKPVLNEVEAETTSGSAPPPPPTGLLGRLRGVPIPVRVSGALTKPSYGVDLKAALGAATQDKAKQEVGNLLNSLFGKKKKKKRPRSDDGGLPLQ